MASIAPKYRISKSRRDKRQKSVMKMTAPNLVKCKSCGELMMSHKVCKACGKYDGREVIKVEQK
ncbi:MAG: 50S ribosomal protein L32 [Clostridiales bacterium GWE2_32_10]|nr:MAG: 50S ribosomal protein L32 [Clostridiales bacterium GWE2_32_10]HBY21528.1 50S ribosomal protein L32 [Clostridiales bacterium]